MDKKEIRLLIKNLISQNQDTLAEKSVSICNKIISSPQFQNSKEIFAYMALPDEVDLSEVIKTALGLNKKVAIPKIMNKESAEIQFFYLKNSQNIDKQIQNGSYDISEPDTFLLESAELSASSILILVPGRAFTKEGDRLGRGKGYYDRFLSEKIVGSSPTMTSFPNFMIAGVCFDFQIKKSLPVDDRDIRMDFIFY